MKKTHGSNPDQPHRFEYAIIERDVDGYKSVSMIKAVNDHAACTILSQWRAIDEAANRPRRDLELVRRPFGEWEQVRESRGI
jgi:hypothetical protein